MATNMKLSPEEYREILNGISLESIGLKQSKTFINTDVKPPNEIKININDSSEFKLEADNLVSIFQTYEIDARPPKSKSRYLHLKVTFIVKILSEKPFTEDFFNIYKEISLHLNSWPYLREYINQVSSRMNITPLTLPFFKS